MLSTCSDIKGTIEADLVSSRPMGKKVQVKHRQSSVGILTSPGTWMNQAPSTSVYGSGSW